jgi:hypothetical protein
MMAMSPLLALALLSGVFPTQAKDPEEVLTTYMGDLEKAIKNTTAKNLPDRAKLEQAARLAFDRELAASAPSVPKLVWDYQSKHLDNLRLGDKKFPEEPSKAERALWITACKAVFNREIARAKEPDAPPSTEQLFETFFDAVREVEKMFPLALDLRSDGVASARTIFAAQLLKSVPTTKDAKIIYNERLVRIDKSFPITGDKTTANTEACTVLKNAAKSLFDRDLPGGKK